MSISRYLRKSLTKGSTLVLAVAFAPDQHTMLTGSSDGTARLWLLHYQDAVHALCQQLQRDFSEHERIQYALVDRAPTCVEE